MSKAHADSQGTPMGFWKRVGLALEAMSESEEERLERRISRLEAGVKRLSKLQEGALNQSRDGEAQNLVGTSLSHSPAPGQSRPA